MVSGNQIEQLGDRWRKAADHEIAIEENRRDLSTLEEVVQIAVGTIEFVDLVVELAVDRLQLLVDRLGLLLGGFQLLVGGLELLIDRQHFLIRRFQLLGGAFLFFDDRLHVLAHGR